MTSLGVDLFGFILFGTFCASWAGMSISFTRLGKLSVIIFSHRLSISCSLSSPPGTSVMQTLVHLKVSHRFLTLSSFGGIVFSLLFWLFSASFSSKSLTGSFASSTLLLIPCNASLHWNPGLGSGAGCRPLTTQERPPQLRNPSWFLPITRGWGTAHFVSPTLLPVLTWLLLCIPSCRASVQLGFRRFWMTAALQF